MEFNGYVLELNLSVDDRLKNSYPFNIPALENFDALRLHPAVTYFVGENGMGKSTLLEAIAVVSGFNAEGGGKNFSFSTRKTHSCLHEYLKLVKGHKQMKDSFFLRSESFYNLASQLEDLDSDTDLPGEMKIPKLVHGYGGIYPHEQSHGESFWSLFNNRFRGNGLYLLDEPESALSAGRQMAMLSKIHDLVEMKSQFIIATHSPVIMAYPNSIIYEFGENGIKRVKYKETEAYMIFREFLNNPEKMLSILLGLR